MGKIDSGCKFASHSLMISEFAAIVISDRMNSLLMRHELLCDGIINRVGRLLADTLDDSVQRFTHNQRHQGATMTFVDHYVTFPVTKR